MLKLFDRKKVDLNRYSVWERLAKPSWGVWFVYLVHKEASDDQ